MADFAQNVTITDKDTAVDPGKDAGTPTGYKALKAGSNGQINGTSGNDKATLADLIADKDHIINLGAGDDVFIFRNDGAGENGNINGIVDGGVGGNDRAFMAGQLSDYIFSIRSDGGIKIHYIPDGDDGAAVTFRNFEQFTFRGVDTDGVNHVDQTFSYEALIAQINAHAASPTT